MPAARDVDATGNVSGLARRLAQRTRWRIRSLAERLEAHHHMHDWATTLIPEPLIDLANQSGQASDKPALATLLTEHPDLIADPASGPALEACGSSNQSTEAPRSWSDLVADDFVVLTDGTDHHLHELREQIARVLAPLGLRFSPAKTRIVHMSQGFDFLGFRIQWKRKRGANKWYVYTFIADRPFRSVKATIRALTPRTSQHDLRALLIRINQITRGWTNYFKHAIAQRIFSKLQHHTWWRIVRMMRTRHRWKWTDVRRWLTDHTGRWHPISADGIELFNPETIPIIRYRYRGNQIPNPWVQAA